jgi:pimeloyl-ACP methyl ester carboxylesterase
MHSRFYKLLDSALAEVCRREPTYISSFPMGVSHAAKMAFAYRQHPLCNKFHSETLEQALIEGLAYLRKSWTKSQPASNGDDPVTHFLCDSIIDAFCADQGLLALEPNRDLNRSISEVFEQEYTQRQTREGLWYYVRNRGSEPLLLINATGAPIAIWRYFLGDSTHDFKIIVPRRRGSDLFQGGLQQDVDIRIESADLASVLDSELLEEAAVVAWCNGARVAIDLATQRPRQISSLVLVGPMLKGIRGVKPKLSGFERDLQPLLDAVTKEASLAPFLSKTIAQQPQSPDWARLASVPQSRARALFGLPAKDYAWGIMASLTEPSSFINIARRVASDENYPMDQALAKLATRTMVIQGSHDQVVSNELASSAMRQICTNSILKITLAGSGHYIHDLQYHYFRLLLTEFLVNHQPPPSTARILVEELSRAQERQTNVDFQIQGGVSPLVR